MTVRWAIALTSALMTLSVVSGSEFATAKPLQHSPRSLLRYTQPLFPNLPNQTPVPQPIPTITEASLPELERQIFEKVNQYRVQRGMRALRIDPRIAAQARAHSRAFRLGTTTLSNGRVRLIELFQAAEFLKM